jgi:hypothetical protein
MENSKHQKTNFKQIPMTQIQKPKPDQPDIIPVDTTTDRQWLEW